MLAFLGRRFSQWAHAYAGNRPVLGPAQLPQAQAADCLLMRACKRPELQVQRKVLATEPDVDFVVMNGDQVSGWDPGFAGPCRPLGAVVVVLPLVLHSTARWIAYCQLQQALAGSIGCPGRVGCVGTGSRCGAPRPIAYMDSYVQAYICTSELSCRPEVRHGQGPVTGAAMLPT